MRTTLFRATTSRGLLVTVDGPNASGKTSIASAVSQLLRERGMGEVQCTRQPSASPIGVLSREVEPTVRGRALACLVAADRHHQIATEIGPALERETIVVCDRYIESSLVLQRIDGVDIGFILDVNDGILRPHLRVRLVAAEPTLKERVASRARDPRRRFEGMPGGSGRELELYAEADALLTRSYGLPSLLLDTSGSEVSQQAKIVADEIHRLREESA